MYIIRVQNESAFDSGISLSYINQRKLTENIIMVRFLLVNCDEKESAKSQNNGNRKCEIRGLVLTW